MKIFAYMVLFLMFIDGFFIVYFNGKITVYLSKRRFLNGITKRRNVIKAYKNGKLEEEVLKNYVKKYLLAFRINLVLLFVLLFSLTLKQVFE